jgi:hypothetical protein
MSTRSPRNPRLATGLSALLALTAASCGANNAASKIRDENPNAAGVMHDDHGGGSCTGVDKPLVVDADESLRGEIEVAMAHGIAVVAYDCKKIRILNCKAQGDYAYSGFTTQQERVQLRNADEIRANLPLSGVAMAAKLEGALNKGVSLDIAYTMIGKKTSTAEITSKMLTGADCGEATHFVRGAMLGAFAMSTSSSAEVKATVEVGKVGAGADSQSAMQIDKKQGVLESCMKASPDDAKPHPQCAGLIRLELVVLGKRQGGGEGEAAEGDAKPIDPGGDTNSCPPGLTWAEGKCGVPSGAAAHACKEGDFPDCSAQCVKGSAESCNQLGMIYQRGNKEVKNDAAKAEESYQAACNKKLAAGCTNLAGLYRWGQGTVKKDDEAFKKYATLGCNSGEGRACYMLANLYWSSSKDDEKVRSGGLFARGCSSGYAQSCFDLGSKLNGSDRDRFGKAFLGNQPAGISYMGKACKAGLDYACTSTADAYAAGNGTDRDGLHALELYQVACERGNAVGCYRAGHLYERGPLTKDEKKAAELYKKACELKTPEGKPASSSEKGCMYLGRLLERGAGVPKDEIAAAGMYKKSCDVDDNNGRVTGCVDLARIYEQGKGVAKSGGKAAEILAFGCKGYNAPACLAMAQRYGSGQGLPTGEAKDEKKSVDMYKRACGGAPDACLTLATFSQQGKGGLAKDDKAVASYYARACIVASNHDMDLDYSASVSTGCVKLATVEAAGKGVTRDETKAALHFGLACARGDKASCDQQKKLAAKAPPPAK